MSASDGGPESVSGKVVLRRRPSTYLTPAIPQLAVFLSGVALLIMEPRQWLVPAMLLGVAGWMLLVRTSVYRTVRRRPEFLEFTPDGATWLDQQIFVPWNAFAEVRVRRSLLRRGQYGNIRLVDHAQTSFAHRARTAPMGHTIYDHHSADTGEQVLAAVRLYRDLPVVNE